jgi:hypothetical protein
MNHEESVRGWWGNRFAARYDGYGIITCADAVDLLIHFEKEFLAELEKMYPCIRPRKSATLTFGGKVSTTILVGQTAASNYEEWSGPNGTGDELPPAGAVTYQSSNPAVATVDPNLGTVTGVSAPGGSATATITATDAANELSATATVTVTEVAESATLTLTPNPVSAAAQAAAKVAKKA